MKKNEPMVSIEVGDEVWEIPLAELTPPKATRKDAVVKLAHRLLGRVQSLLGDPQEVEKEARFLGYSEGLRECIALQIFQGLGSREWEPRDTHAQTLDTWLVQGVEHVELDSQFWALMVDITPKFGEDPGMSVTLDYFLTQFRPFGNIQFRTCDA